MYHEKQDAGLCGVHALNNLLQGAYFTEIDLMEIAHQLDSKETTLMAESGLDTSDYLKFAAEDSSNVGLDGNFSIDVLKDALGRLNLSVVPLLHPSMRQVQEQPTLENAFLCNLQSHWFAIRKIGNSYWNLNSLYKTPNQLGELYLGIFLKQLQVEGYSIFVVTGPLPHPSPPSSDSQWWVYVPAAQKQHQASGQLSEEEQLRLALAESIQAEDDQLSAAISASLQQPPPPQQAKTAPLIVLQDNQPPINTSLVLLQDDEEETELSEAIRLSLQKQ
uniref:ubiquitinyl hydrolase 1 n=1 Tax=Arcella intermedia TaxID=1963864 RepID=A0A6B2LD89_9EUKA